MNVLPPLKIAPISDNDAADFISFLKKIDAETQFLLWEPGERNSDLAYQNERIQKIDPKRQLVLVARMGNIEIIGFLSALVGSTKRTSHRADFTMGVLAEFR